MRWSILIASHCARVDRLPILANSLAPQLTPDVEVVVLWNRGGLKLGDYRRMLTTDARGDYVCNIDDDDRVADDYVSAILEALESDPDYVGFEVELLDIGGQIGRAGRKYRAVHSLKTKTWHQKGPVFYRHVSHLNPVRRDLALKGVWEGNYGEDHRWADSTVEHVKSEVFIPRAMYFYDMDHRLSLRGDSYDDAPYERPVLPAGFRYHPDSEV